MFGHNESMNHDFNYIIEKISSADIISHPYPHLEIKNFLSPEHIESILADEQIHFQQCNTTKELINTLIDKGYKAIGGAGVTHNVNQYLNTNSGLGMGFRLDRPKGLLAINLIKYFRSDTFWKCLKRKFDVQRNTRIKADIRKYLTGYEISPHPDGREKAMTMLLNINAPEAEIVDVHTHVLVFKKEYEYMYEEWEKNTEDQRKWVSWEWCETKKTISENNTILIFPPGNRSLHAVKLDYDHLKFQRTQLYGNLWFAQ